MPILREKDLIKSPLQKIRVADVNTKDTAFHKARQIEAIF
jgi:hypothetical protein